MNSQLVVKIIIGVLVAVVGAVAENERRRDEG